MGRPTPRQIKGRRTSASIAQAPVKTRTPPPQKKSSIPVVSIPYLKKQLNPYHNIMLLGPLLFWVCLIKLCAGPAPLPVTSPHSLVCSYWVRSQGECQRAAFLKLFTKEDPSKDFQDLGNSQNNLQIYRSQYVNTISNLQIYLQIEE